MANNSGQNNYTCSENDEKHVLLVKYILGGWISCVVGVLGIISNGLSILILANHRMRYLSTNIYLLALSIVNLVWLILYLIVNSIRFTVIVPRFMMNSHDDDRHVYDDWILR